jgi:hypothetical protein
LWDFHRPWAATERLETHPPKPSIEPVIEYVSAAAYLGDPEVLAKLQRISRLLYGER